METYLEDTVGHIKIFSVRILSKNLNKPLNLFHVYNFKLYKDVMLVRYGIELTLNEPFFMQWLYSVLFRHKQSEFGSREHHVTQF
jgi:hypothetical protein